MKYVELGRLTYGSELGHRLSLISDKKEIIVDKLSTIISFFLKCTEFRDAVQQHSRSRRHIGYAIAPSFGYCVIYFLKALLFVSVLLVVPLNKINNWKIFYFKDFHCVNSI